MSMFRSRMRRDRPGRVRRVLAIVLALTLVPLAAIVVYDSFFAAPPVPQRAHAGEQPATQPATQPAEHEHTNHLINENSPYLQMHAHNPVDWYPWGEKAFEKAKREDKPIFLSVGYSTCYWCQVMDRESFVDEQVAAILNEHFVSIKVDRERRPDIDEKYMLATRLMTGRGGWPNSVWLTPAGKPWMAGTYFPKEQFMQLLNRLADAWDNRRQRIEQQADRMAQAIQRASTGGMVKGAQASQPLSDKLVRQAIRGYRDSFDQTHGGFGGAPKFPPHGALRILTHRYRTTNDKPLREMITATLDAIWLGGVHDHLGGGFHRYSTDAEWLLPHFEKMLYDNAQLMRAYTDGYRMTEKPRYRRAVAGIYRWLGRKMAGDGGRFFSAIDSEIAGEEGETYVWHYDEIINVLGETDGALFAKVYNVDPDGNYTEEATGERPGTNILHLDRPITELAKQRGAEPRAFRQRLRKMCRTLLSERDTWRQPEVDDKTITAWSGMMIASLAYAGRTLDEPKYTRAAADAAEFILQYMRPDGRLMRIYRGGEASQPAFLDDYANLARGLLELYRATGHPRWLNEAQGLADTMLARFADEQDGGFFFTTESHEQIMGTRSKRLQGSGNVPTANGVAAEVMLELGRVTEESRYTDAGVRTLESLSGVMAQSPRAVESLVYDAAMHLNPIEQKSPRATTETAKQSDASATQPSDDAEPDAVHENAPVTASVFSSRLRVHPGQTFHVAVALDIHDGWHLYGPNPDVDFVKPTTVAMKSHASFSAGDMDVPAGRTKQDPVLDQKLTTYEGRVWFRLPVTVSRNAETGETKLVLELNTQACDARRCLPPRTTSISVPVTVDPDADVERPLRHPDVFTRKARAMD